MLLTVGCDYRERSDSHRAVRSRARARFSAGALTFSTGFALGLGAMLIAMFDFLGYYSVCYVGGEVRNPERNLPRAIFYSVIAVALIIRS